MLYIGNDLRVNTDGRTSFLIAPIFVKSLVLLIFLDVTGTVTDFPRRLILYTLCKG